MQVFYLITELDVGGAEKSLYELATRLDRDRFRPVVGCLSGQGEVGTWLAEKGVETVHFNMRSKWDWGVVGRVKEELVRRHPDILHTFLFHANFVGRLAARRAGLRHVISAVRVEETRRLHLWGDRLTRGLMDYETCVSESTRQYTHRHAKVPLDKLVVIPNGIDVTRYEVLPPPPDAWHWAAGRRIVSTVARLDEQKDPLTLIRAIERVCRVHPDVVLAWAGDGPLRPRVEQEVSRRGLMEQVHLLGRLEDVRPLLGLSEVFVLASRWEGMPNSVLEAMACSLPVVTTNVGGCPEMVVEGETGFLVSPGNPVDLAERLSRLVGDASLRRRLGDASRSHVQRRFSLEAMVAANERLYERLHSGQRRGQGEMS